MFILGHIGFTVGIFVLILYQFPRFRPKFDIRFIALGAMLPDIIDKTVGLLILREYIDNGRIFSHTLLFSSVLTMLAFAIKKRGLSALAFGSWTHIAFDRMWEVVETLFWPVFRWDFPRTGFYPGRWIELLLTDPYVYISEIVGTVILISLFFYFKLYRIENWRTVFRKGDLPFNENKT